MHGHGENFFQDIQDTRHFNRPKFLMVTFLGLKSSTMSHLWTVTKSKPTKIILN